jgi:hypothetical protein
MWSDVAGPGVFARQRARGAYLGCESCFLPFYFPINILTITTITIVNFFINDHHTIKEESKLAESSFQIELLLNIALSASLLPPCVFFWYSLGVFYEPSMG